jgi:hypothetical protein
MPTTRSLAWASLAFFIITSATAAADTLPQPVSSATTVLKALFPVFGTRATVVNDDLIKLEGTERVFFRRVPGSDCRFIEAQPDKKFAGQIDFSRLSGEYDTAPDCLGSYCSTRLRLFGKGPAVCWTNQATYPLTGTPTDYSLGQCFSTITFPGMDEGVVRMVLRAVSFIQSTSCRPISDQP